MHRHLDYIIFCTASLAVYFTVQRWIWRGRDGGRLPLLSGIFAVLLLAAGWWWVESAENGESERIHSLVDGYGPTYASEIEAMEHASISEDTSPDDPKYLRIIEAQKRWLSVNKSITDIYTMRRNADGKIVLIVDSETDYDRNGIIEGEKEERTVIGEVYEESEPALEAALNGKPGFTTELISDRWGTWISTFVPLHKPDGSLDGIVGIDFDPDTWNAAVREGRGKALGVVALILSALLTANGAVSHMLHARAITSNLREQERLRLSQLKFETLVNSIDGIVWEFDAKTRAFTYVSEQSERILGYPSAQWIDDPEFWQSRIHPDDTWVHERRKKMIGGMQPSPCDYRMIAADGRTVWIRECAATLRDEKGEPVLVRGVFRDITDQKRAEEELAMLHKQLVESSRRAGMAEVATGVLHNVGNVLNSVNVSSNLISERIHLSKVSSLRQVAALLREHDGRLPDFLASDSRGRVIPELIQRLTDAILEEQRLVGHEAELVLKNVAHIRDIVAMQQNCATVSGITEHLCVEELVEDAVQINISSLTRHDIRIDRDYADVPEIFADRHKVLQILVNLIRNAKQALDETDREEKHLKLRVRATGHDTVTIAIIDNGNGIPQENLSRIFSHGFTTKKDGHGFGLHSGALAAREMNGSLRAESDGIGRGATFILELPVGEVASIPAVASLS